MSQIWIGPVLLALLCLVWFAVQRAWISCMDHPADRDALERPGYCGTACVCRAELSAPAQECNGRVVERGDLKS